MEHNALPPLHKNYEDENLSRSGRKDGLIPASQFRPPLPDTNPNIRKDNSTEKRKRAVPKRFRPSTAPKPTTTQPPATVSQVPVKPKTDAPETDPHLWRMFHFARALHGLAQEKCR